MTGDVVKQDEIAPLRQVGELCARHGEQCRVLPSQRRARVVRVQNQRVKLHPRPGGKGMKGITDRSGGTPASEQHRRFVGDTD